MKIGYARCSTDKQTLDSQIHPLTLVGCEKIYKDEAMSGSSRERPGLDECLNSLQEGDCLIVYRLDRLGRSLEHVMELIKQFEKRKIDFKSLSEGFDTTTPAGKLLFHIIGSLAEFERSLIRERTISGLNAARARGTKLGRKFSIHQETEDRVHELYKKNLSLRQIANQTGISHSSVARIVKFDQDQSLVS